MRKFPIVVKGAYGRSYFTLESAKYDWEKGLDFFLLVTGQYCSKRDFEGEAVSIQLASGIYEVLQ